MIFLTKKNKNKKDSSLRKSPVVKLPSLDDPSFKSHYIRKISDLDIQASADFGFGNALLGEISRSLTPSSLKVPQAVAVSRQAFQRFLSVNRLEKPIRNVLNSIEGNLPDLMRKSQLIRNLILDGRFPADLIRELQIAYYSLDDSDDGRTRVAVRNSPLIKGLPAGQFVGEHSALLNVRDVESLLRAAKRVFAEAFNDRAIAYCQQNDIDPLSLSVSLSLQKIVRADLGVSGMMFTMDAQSGFSDVINISSTYGFSESIANGRVNPDEFQVFKPALEKGYKSIVRRQLGDKSLMRVFASESDGLTDIKVKADAQKRFSISDDEVMQLALHGAEIEMFCARATKQDCAVEIEWARDGETGDFYVLQAVPAAASVNGAASRFRDYQLLESGWVLSRGKSVGNKIVTGFARVIDSIRDMDSLQPGEVLITSRTDPGWEPVLGRAAAIVTDTGGRLSHAVVVAQELGVPAIVGCDSATKSIRTGSIVTVVCGEHDHGYVYDGELAYKVEERDYAEISETSTRLRLTLDDPDRAFEYAGLPVDGVGLFSLESVIENEIRIHPRGLLEYASQTPEVQFDIDDIVNGYPDRRTFYVQKLAEGIGRVAAAFYPRQVTVRFSDFRTNEFAALFAGETFEQQEGNPKIGLRGASRYLSSEFTESFAMECDAIHYVHTEMGLTNINVVVPFVRTPDEGRALMEIIEDRGLRRAGLDLNVFMMCETPANVLLADEFLKIFDGFTIGTGDLLELTIGVDRDNAALHHFDERNVALLKLIYLAKDACQRAGKPIEISGCAPSDHKEITQWLVEQGVDSISFDPQRFFEMHKVVKRAEEQLFDSDTQEIPFSVKAAASAQG